MVITRTLWTPLVDVRSVPEKKCTIFFHRKKLTTHRQTLSLCPNDGAIVVWTRCQGVWACRSPIQKRRFRKWGNGGRWCPPILRDEWRQVHGTGPIFPLKVPENHLELSIKISSSCGTFCIWFGPRVRLSRYIYLDGDGGRWAKQNLFLLLFLFFFFCHFRCI